MVDKKKIDFANAAQKVQKGAMSLWAKTMESVVKAVDQNDA